LPAGRAQRDDRLMAAWTRTAASLLTGCGGAARHARPEPWWASYQRPGATQAAIFRGQPGSAGYRCVPVSGHRNVRSGGFLAGPFGFDQQSFAAVYRQGGRRTELKIYWIPLHVARMAGVTVQANLIGGTAVTHTTNRGQIAAAGKAVFYPTAVPIPAPGTWQLTGRAGADRGCFVVTFRA
jgi:hypothetical protein